ncbi:predicted protein [Plenodomus lingam JN3]|uniref:Predicted protein n=1 Tax=Leptosphaeria maculans (strain JN3 / isolate v23.1.3 / race Av1-4-5-6-7-8) TaxID=985895 RepID=E4ZTC0_LEPMJ|nr:predicted protein [Plenodomus lingam JN3]CBX94776.1 predicted protein [Plenodomus lingam JN3]
MFLLVSLVQPRRPRKYRLASGLAGAESSDESARGGLVHGTQSRRITKPTGATSSLKTSSRPSPTCTLKSPQPFLSRSEAAFPQLLDRKALSQSQTSVVDGRNTDAYMYAMEMLAYLWVPLYATSGLHFSSAYGIWRTMVPHGHPRRTTWARTVGPASQHKCHDAGLNGTLLARYMPASGWLPIKKDASLRISTLHRRKGMNRAPEGSSVPGRHYESRNSGFMRLTHTQHGRYDFVQLITQPGPILWSTCRVTAYFCRFSTSFAQRVAIATIHGCCMPGADEQEHFNRNVRCVLFTSDYTRSSLQYYMYEAVEASSVMAKSRFFSKSDGALVTK